MTKKDEEIYNVIKLFYQENKLMPSIRYLQKYFKYKSPNSIYKHLKVLEKEMYLSRNKNNHIILNNFSIKDNIREINIINTSKTIKLLLEKKGKYCAFILKNNLFIKRHLCKGDILIIEKQAKMHNNDLGLFIIDNRYQIMNYQYNNGFYILSSNETIYLNKIHIIGKVIMVERQIKTLV